MYTTRNNLQNYLRVTISGSNLESHIDTVFIPTVEKFINNYCFQPNGFEEVTITRERVQGLVTSDGELFIRPKNKPVNTLTELQIGKGTSYTTLQLTDNNGDTRYEITESSHIIFPNQEISLTGTFTISSFWDLRYKRFFAKVSYTTGFETLPADLVHAATLLLASMYRKGEPEIGNKKGLRGFSQGQLQAQYIIDTSGKDELVNQALSLLNHYKNVEV